MKTTKKAFGNLNKLWIFLFLTSASLSGNSQQLNLAVPGSSKRVAADAVPFSCNTSSYQVASSDGVVSSLYEYNIITGVRSAVAILDHYVNAIGYNPVDNMIWGYAPNTGEVVRIDASGIVTPFTIQNLPVNAYNVGDVMNNGYLFLYAQNTSTYFVVDINPARSATYLKLVDPTLAYALEATPFGTTMTALAITDWSYNPQTGLFYTLQNGTAKITSLNPATGEIIIAATAVSGDNITSDAAAFGATFLDNTGNLYVFSNGTGRFYRINIAANTATFMSTSTPSGANDGARCNLSDLIPAVPFACSTSSYQVVGEGSFSRLYEYDIVTGVRNSVAFLDHYVNAIGFNNVDNLIWGYAPNTNEVVRIDAAGAVTAYVIPNLPQSAYNVGDVMNGGYLFLYSQGSPSYFVVDIDPSRTATYLKLVDPTAAYALEAAPFGTIMTGIAITDWSYNPQTGLFYTLQNGTAAITTLNPTTGELIIAATPVSGAGITGDAAAFGATFLDNAGNLYAFSNGTGKFYKINLVSNTATFMSTSTPSGANDGARCNLAEVTPAVPFACTTSSYQVASTGSSVPSTLYQYNISTGLRTSVASLDRYVNAIGYNNVDNLMWGYAPNTNEVARIDASGAVAGFIIPNLPKISYNVGDVMNGGYLFLYSQNIGNFYVVDVNPARPATYLKLVDPAAGYVAEGAPYGTTMSALAISDWSYNPKDGLFYALQSFTAILATINPATGTVVKKAEAITSNGTSIAGDAQSGFGATFLDNEGSLYVFSNGSGNFYKVNATANTALLMSNSIASIANDGARCNLAAPIPLPVTLISFTVEKNGSENPSALLKWTTSSETNSDHFDVERSETGKNWANIGNVISNGESTALLGYSFKDTQPKSGENLYRLRMVDKDGTFAFSRIQSVTFDDKNLDLSVFPNPSADKLFIRDYNTVKDITVSNLNGITVYKSGSFASGDGFVDLNSFSQGMYIVKISRVNGMVSTHKIVVSK